MQFVRAATFTGPRPGYFFGTGPSGTGYYPDPEAEIPDNKEDLLREAEKAADDALLAEIADGKDLRRLVAQLERKLEQNMEMRAKYPDEPAKFMESEISLDQEIRRMHAVASVPDLYVDFCEAGGVRLLVRLLGHDNGDIAGDAADLLRELTDADAEDDAGGMSRDDALILVAGFAEEAGLEALASRLNGFDETVEEEALGVQNILAAIENFLDLAPQMGEHLVQRTDLLSWILGRLKPKRFDPNKQYASEILAVLLQQSDDVRRKAGEMDGVFVLLKSISAYRKEDPKSEEETEYMLNLFDALCSMLMVQENRERFLAAEGLELMLLILRTKRKAGFGAFRAIDFALTRSPAACTKFVTIFGLKTLFGAFMGKPKVDRERGREGELQMRELEARAVSLLGHLFSQLPEGAEKERLCSKFVENEYEKCDRLVELVVGYLEKDRAAQARFDAGRANGDEGDEEGEEEEMRQLARVDAGLLSLQQLCLSLAALFQAADGPLRTRLIKLLHQNKLPLQAVRVTLAEMHSQVGDADGRDAQSTQRKFIASLLESLGADMDMMEGLARVEAAAEAGGGGNEEPGANGDTVGLADSGNAAGAGGEEGEVGFGERGGGDGDVEMGEGRGGGCG